MPITSGGSVTFNNVSDEEVAKLLDFKSNHESEIQFDPKAMQPMGGQVGHYNGVTVTWRSNEAYPTAHEAILLMIGQPAKP